MGVLGITDKVMAYVRGVAALVFMGLAVYCYVLRADNRAMAAQVQPLKQAAKDAGKLSDGYRTALQKCENEKLAIRQANARAVADAQADKDAADARAEDYARKLANPPKGCAAVMQARVCPALLDY